MRAILLAVAVVCLEACGPGGALVGKWSRSDNLSGSTNKVTTLDFQGDGTLVLGVEITGECTGSGMKFDGWSWSATGTTLSVKGSGTCSGSNSCVTMAGIPATTFDCMSLPMTNLAGDSTFLLNTPNLTVTFPAESTPWMLTRK